MLFRSSARQVRNAQILDLRVLDDALADEAAFPALKNVQVRIEYSGRPSTTPYAVECEVAVVKGMPKMRAAGALEIVSWRPPSPEALRGY